MALTNEQRREPITPVTAPAWWEVLGPEEFLQRYRRQCYSEFAAEQKAKEPLWYAKFWNWFATGWNEFQPLSAMILVLGVFLTLIVFLPRLPNDNSTACRACASGNVPACLQAVAGQSDLKDNDEQAKARLYRTLYRNATGHDLPELK